MIRRALPQRGVVQLTTEPSELILCRCESVTAREVERAVAEHGARTSDQIKKLTRAGMGPCQGRTCEHLLHLALTSVVNEPVPRRVRPPLRAIPLQHLAEVAGDFPAPRGTVTPKVLWGESEGGSTLTLEPSDGADT